VIPARRIWRLTALAALAWMPSFNDALAGEPVAVITEIHAERGGVQVKRADQAEWRPIQPLLALRPGDQLRATGEGRAVIVFTGGRGSQTAMASNSPLVIEAPKDESTSEKLRRVLSTVTDRLISRQKSLDSKPVTVREGRLPPVAILSPRATLLSPGPVVFEWSGSDTLSYRVRVSGPQGAFWEAANLPRKPLYYPEGAPPLSPGTPYAWELEAPGHPAQRAEFEILSEEAAARIQDDLDVLTLAALPGYPPATMAVMRAGLLVRERLNAQARLELLRAILLDPSEPTLHLLLEQVYEVIGLQELPEGRRE